LQRGLRVIEDTARFVLDKDAVYRKARALRHKADAATRGIYPALLAQRDSVSDSGRRMKEAGGAA